VAGFLVLLAGIAAAAEPAPSALSWRVKVPALAMPVVVEAGPAAVVALDKSGGIAVINPRTGALSWSAKAPRKASAAEPTRFALQDSTVVVAWPAATELIGFDAQTGAERWRRRTGAVVSGLVSCGTHAAVVASHRAQSTGTDLDPVVHAVDPADGATLWMERAIGPVVDGQGGHVFVQDRRLGSDYRLDVFRCADAGKFTIGTPAGTVWRVFEVARDRALAEVSYNGNTEFEVCEFSLSEPTAEPRCKDLSPLLPAGYRLTGALWEGEILTVSWAAAPGKAKFADAEAQVAVWDAKRVKVLGKSPAGTSSQALLLGADGVLATHGAGKKGPHRLTLLDPATAAAKWSVALTAAPLRLMTAGDTAVVAQADGAIAGLVGSLKSTATKSAPVAKRSSNYRCVGE
jgi:outer membrane protein assembly factor BamB